MKLTSVIACLGLATVASASFGCVDDECVADRCDDGPAALPASRITPSGVQPTDRAPVGPDGRHIPHEPPPRVVAKMNPLAGPAAAPMALADPEGPGTTPLTLAWSRVETGYTTDAMALGNVHAAPGDELVVLSQGSTWYGNPPSAGTGKVIVLRTNGALLTEFFPPTLRDIMGFPTIVQLDSMESEYLVGEFMSPASGGAVYALTGTSTDASSARWIHSPRAWPGYWNMGQSVGNVFPGGGDEIVIADWNGVVQAVRRADGAPVATYDIFANHGENIYGHLAIGNVDGGGGNEIVAVGATAGRVIVLSPQADGTMTALYVSNPDPDGGYASGSGPAIGDIDGDGLAEIIVAYSGPRPVIRAFDFLESPGGQCEYEWTMTGGADYYWTSPVVGDVDGDGAREVVVMSTDGIVSVLSTEGITSNPTTCVEGAYDTPSRAIGGGGSSWFTPALANLSPGGGLEIVAATYTTLEVLEVVSGALQVAYEASDATATFYPSAIIKRGTGGPNPGAKLFLSGWVNGGIYEYDTPGGAPVPTADWHTFMGNNRRTGTAVDGSDDCSVCGSGNCEQACTSNCNLVCSDPSCTCDLGCPGTTDKCKALCEAGSACTVDCASASDCKPNCLDDSSCDVDCTDAAKCDSKCKDASTCQVACSGADDCKTSCEGAATCAVDCGEDAGTCKLDCKNDSSCTMACGNADQCVPKCKNNATCAFDCTAGDGCKARCENDSTCAIDCTGAASCDQECLNDSTCTINCTEADDCDNVKCNNNAECLLDCTDAVTCGFSECSHSEMSCPGDVIACNMPCP